MANYKLVNSDQLDTDMKTVADKIREKAQLSDLLSWPSGYVEGIDQCSSLNFSIVGGTIKPTEPVENTIWVNTDNEITSWVISPEQPDNPKSGMLWLSNGSYGDVSFNALKKNEIVVFPTSAKHYINGIFQDVEYNIYQNGTWGEPVTGVLYDSGNEYDSFTGGWIAEGLDASLEDWEYYSTEPELSKNSSNMTASLYYSEHYRSGIIRHLNPIDLSEYNTLVFDGYSSHEWYVRLCVLPTEYADYDDAIAEIEIGTNSDAYALDLTGIYGLGYVAIFLAVDDENFGVTATANKIWLE